MVCCAGAGQLALRELQVIGDHIQLILNFGDCSARTAPGADSACHVLLKILVLLGQRSLGALCALGAG